MLKHSIIFGFILKIYYKIINHIFESQTWNFLTSINRKFNNATQKSCIFKLCTNSDKFDRLYQNKFKCFITFFEKLFTRMFAPLKKAITNSMIFNKISTAYHNFLNIPLVYFGITFVIWGISLLLRSILSRDFKIAYILSALILGFGIILIILKSSIITLTNTSFFVRNTIKILGFDLPESHDSTESYNLKTYIVLGFVLGILSFIFGAIPITLTFFLFIAIIFSFCFTSLVAIIFVCVLPFMPTMVMVGGSLALFTCVIVKTILGFKDKLFNEQNLLNMFLLFMGISFFLSAIFSFSKMSSIRIALVYIAFLCVTFALIKLLSTKKMLFSALNCISIFSIPVSLFGIYQHFTGFDEQNTWIDTEMFDEISGRVVSFFGNPNVFGEYLILIILTSLVCFFIMKNRYIKLSHLITVALASISLIFTYSRGCWIGVLFAVVVFLFISKRKFFAAFCVLGVCSVFFLPDSIITRFLSVGNLADSSTSYRVYIWEGTIKMLKDYWLTGIGLGSDAFNSVYPLYAYSAISAPHPHNLYLLILTETGIVGAVAFLLIILLYFKRLFTVIKFSHDLSLKTISAALVAAMGGYLLQGMFDNVWYNYRIFLLFWIYIALGAIVDIVSRRTKNEQN